jgi:hypothetical protein
MNIINVRKYKGFRHGIYDRITSSVDGGNIQYVRENSEYIIENDVWALFTVNDLRYNNIFSQIIYELNN